MATYPAGIEEDVADIFIEALGALSILLFLMPPAAALASWLLDIEADGDRISEQLRRLRSHTRRSIERDGVELPPSPGESPPSSADALTALQEAGQALAAGVAEGKSVEEIGAAADTAADRLARRTVTLARLADTRQEQESAGVTHFRWVTRQDDRVRPAHRALHGQVFSWSQGAPVEGYPGQPWGCRCSAAPVQR